MRLRLGLVLAIVLGLLTAHVAVVTRHTEVPGGRELDCFACYLAIAATAETVAPVVPMPIWDAPVPLVAATVPAPAEAFDSPIASRGPPTL